MLRISQIKLRPEHTKEDLKDAILHYLKIQETELLEYHIFKQSIDARKKPDIFLVYTIDVVLREEERIKKRLKKKVQTVCEKKYLAPLHGTENTAFRPVIAGAGPAGLFCAYLLAEEGYRPKLKMASL